MVLGGQPPGRVGRCRDNCRKARASAVARAFARAGTTRQGAGICWPTWPQTGVGRAAPEKADLVVRRRARARLVAPLVPGARSPAPEVVAPPVAEETAPAAQVVEGSVNQVAQGKFGARRGKQGQLRAVGSVASASRGARSGSAPAARASSRNTGFRTTDGSARRSGGPGAERSYGDEDRRASRPALGGERRTWGGKPPSGRTAGGRPRSSGDAPAGSWTSRAPLRRYEGDQFPASTGPEGNDRPPRRPSAFGTQRRARGDSPRPSSDGPRWGRSANADGSRSSSDDRPRRAAGSSSYNDDRPRRARRPSDECQIRRCRRP